MFVFICLRKLRGRRFYMQSFNCLNNIAREPLLRIEDSSTIKRSNGSNLFLRSSLSLSRKWTGREEVSCNRQRQKLWRCKKLIKKMLWLLHLSSNWKIYFIRVLIVSWINSNIRLVTKTHQDVDKRKTSKKSVVKLMRRCHEHHYENSELKR